MNVETVNSVIDALANKLAVPAEYVLNMLIRQGKFSISSTIISGIFVIVLLILSFVFYNKHKKENENRYMRSETEIYIILTIACLVGSLFLFANFLFYFTDSINWLIDPEAYGFKELLRIISRGGK